MNVVKSQNCVILVHLNNVLKSQIDFDHWTIFGKFSFQKLYF
jgi:hypothetical protein